MVEEFKRLASDGEKSLNRPRHRETLNLIHLFQESPLVTGKKRLLLNG